MTIASTAARFGFSTEELFEKAYQEERGFLWGLAPPKELHRLWSTGWTSAPPYVTKMVARLEKL